MNMNTSALSLLYLPASPFSKKVMYVVRHYEVPVELKSVNPFIPEERAALRALSPLGKLPVLQGAGNLLGESSVIVEDIEQRVGRNDFIPENKALSRQVRYWDRLLDTYLIAPTLELLINQFQGRDSEADVRLQDKLYRIATLYGQLEEQLKKGVHSKPDQTGVPTLLEEGLTLADVTAISILPLAHQVKPIDDYRYLSAYLEAHSRDPIWQSINKEVDAYMPDFIASVQRAAA